MNDPNNHKDASPLEVTGASRHDVREAWTTVYRPRLIKAFKASPETWRTILKQRYRHGFSIEQSAATFDLKIKEIETHQRNALESLRKRLLDDGLDLQVNTIALILASEWTLPSVQVAEETALHLLDLNDEAKLRPKSIDRPRRVPIADRDPRVRVLSKLKLISKSEDVHARPQQRAASSLKKTAEPKVYLQEGFTYTFHELRGSILRITVEISEEKSIEKEIHPGDRLQILLSLANNEQRELLLEVKEFNNRLVAGPSNIQGLTLSRLEEITLQCEQSPEDES